jgi:hypothetical protein
MRIDDTAAPATEAATTTEPATVAKPTKKTKAKSKPKAKAKVTKPKQTAAAKLVALVTRKQGVTHAEACKAVGWKQCRPYLLKSCAAAGIRLRKERQENGEVRYFGSKR